MIPNAEELVTRPESPTLRVLRRDALGILTAALREVDAERALQARLRKRGESLEANGLRWDLEKVGAIRLLAVGKASLPMARAALRVVEPTEALVVAHTQESLDAPNLTVLQASHPVPREDSLRAGEDALALARRNGPRDLLLVLLSGGGSAMLEHSDLSLNSLQETTRILLRGGADIDALNTVRKHLSLVKGGWLGKVGARRGGEVVTLALSDVVGDDPSLIASGPTVPDPSTFRDAREDLERFGAWTIVPGEVRERIEAGIRGTIDETPKPGDPELKRSHWRTVASIADASRAGSEEARRRGYVPHTYGTQVQGEARAVGQALLEVGISVGERGKPTRPPAAILAGGETTVTVRGRGSGGRNQELVLSAVRGLANRPMVLLSFDTDGRDGETDAAGALADGESLERGLRAGLNPDAYLTESDSHGFFARLGDTIVTGPTGTNVMDLQLLLIGPPPRTSHDGA